MSDLEKPSGSKVLHQIRESLIAEPPWKAKSVIAAAITAGGGLAAWMGDYSPALFRFGVSYIGGFFIGWMFRRFVKIAVVIAGAAIALLAALKGTGWVNLDWAAFGGLISHNLASLQEGAEGLKQLFTGYLPSAASATAGLFFGFRKK